MNKATIFHRCPFPSCTSDEEHAGEHTFARPSFPRGELRLLHTYREPHNSGRWRIPCDVDSVHRLAVAFYVDSLGFGWSLCADCEDRVGSFRPRAGRRTAA
jgi:hypothetical protein